MKANKTHAYESVCISAEKILENAMILIIVLGAKGEVAFINRQGQHILGYEERELIGTNFFEQCVPAEGRSSALTRFQHLIEGTEAAPASLEITIVTKTGKESRLSLSSSVIRDDTGCSCVLCAGGDLAQNEDRDQGILEGIEDGYYELDLRGNLTFFNDKIPLISGYLPEELIGKNFRDYTDKKNAQILLNAYREVVKTGQSSKGLGWELIRKDGSRSYLESSISLIRDSRGRPVGFLGIARDISERNRAETALLASEERYRALAENVQDVLWIIKDMRFTYVSRSVERQWGYRVEDITGQPVEKVLGPQSYQDLKNTLARVHPSNEDEERILSLPIELEVICRDGSKIWTEATINALYDPHGNISGFQCLSRDINLRKMTEDSLEEKFSLLQILIDSIPNPIFYTDTHGRLDGCNRAYEAVCGESKADIVGSPFSDVSPKALFKIYSKEAPRLTGERDSIREYLPAMEYADGSRHDVVLSINTFVDANGRRAGTIGVLFDITDQKRQEHTLQEALVESRMRQAEISALLDASHAVLEKQTFEESSRLILNTCKELIGASAGYISIFGADKGLGEIVFTDLDVTRNSPLRCEGLSGEMKDAVLVQAKTRFYNDISRDYPHAPFDPKPHNILISPLIVEGSTQGLFVLTDKKGGFNEDDTSLAHAFSEFAAIALMNSRTLKSLETSEKRFRSVAQTANDAFITCDSDGRIVFWNTSAERMFGHSTLDAMGKDLKLIIPERFRGRLAIEMDSITHAAGNTSKTDPDQMGRTEQMVAQRKDGREFPIEISLSTWESEQKRLFTYIVRDITERKRLEDDLREETEELRRARGELEKAYKELQNTQMHVLQQEKLASIGQLAAGVAHEINNPMGFISSNLGTLMRYVDKLTEFMSAQAELIHHQDREASAALSEKRKSLKIDFITEDIKDLIKESLEGAERVKKIVQDLKSFSRVDQAELKQADINECMESTINIVWNELKYKATVNKEYGDIPLTRCYPQQLNQVFMNLLVNASHAIAKQGVITVKTWREDDSILVSVSDTGCGIRPENLNRIFEPFFTTKEVGKGTGLGLSITYDIVKKHGGEITVHSEVDKGSTFTVRIPVVKE